MNEIEEFYSYIEMSQVAENLKAWEGCFPSGMYPVISHRKSQALDTFAKQNGQKPL
jgi:hypothetical protein